MYANRTGNLVDEQQKFKKIKLGFNQQKFLFKCQNYNKNLNWLFVQNQDKFK